MRAFGKTLVKLSDVTGNIEVRPAPRRGAPPFPGGAGSCLPGHSGWEPGHVAVLGIKQAAAVISSYE